MLMHAKMQSCHVSPLRPDVRFRDSPRTNLKSIQETVSNNVEVMLRDLDKKVHTQLKQRAEDTEGRFFGQLDQEIKKVSKYAMTKSMLDSSSLSMRPS